jgi:hypothetical protein
MVDWSVVCRLVMDWSVMGRPVMCWRMHWRMVNGLVVCRDDRVSFVVGFRSRVMLVVCGGNRSVVNWSRCLRLFHFLRLLWSRLGFLDLLSRLLFWCLIFLFGEDFKISSWIEWKIVRGVMAHVWVLIGVDVVRVVVAMLAMCAMLKHRRRIRVIFTQVSLDGKWRHHVVVVDLWLVCKMLAFVLDMRETRLKWLVMTVLFRAMMEVGEISAKWINNVRWVVNHVSDWDLRNDWHWVACMSDVSWLINDVMIDRVNIVEHVLIGVCEV